MARLIRLRFSGTCRGCGRGLGAGSSGWWESGQGVACSACGPSSLGYSQRSSFSSSDRYRVISGSVIGSASHTSTGRTSYPNVGPAEPALERIVTMHLWHDEAIRRWIWTVVATALADDRRSGMARSERAARRRAYRRYSLHLRRGWSPGGLFLDAPGRDERIRALEAEVFSPLPS